jgi:alkanesulfonate monooxygenase SsuD/methylene tetrahydromethanopterin reductase-like flavin-dependent oxidoreductase (luciferase family)
MEILEEVSNLVCLADRLGVRYAWFSEHHAHAHHGHLPTPLLLALHLASQTRSIQLGTAIICLNLHHPLDVAEQVAVADVLTKGRMAVGFGSGSTPEEFRLFELPETGDIERHARFQESLQLILSAWSKGGIQINPDFGSNSSTRFVSIPTHQPLPVPAADLARRSWIAVNSIGSARIAGVLGFNVLFSHLRTPEQYREYTDIYRQAGGKKLLAANRPVFVGPDDLTAFRQAEPALRILWRRFQAEGKIAAEMPEPRFCKELCHHPINFVVGGPASVAQQLRKLHDQSPFDVANVEVRWAGLSHELVRESLSRLMQDVMPLVENN